MSHNLLMFIILYGVTFIPWCLSFYSNNFSTQLGLFLIDMGLSIAAYVFLWWYIGWWSVPVGIVMAGIGKIMEGSGIRGYDLILEKK